jgi:hypothetical protein
MSTQENKKYLPTRRRNSGLGNNGSDLCSNASIH